MAEGNIEILHGVLAAVLGIRPEDVHDELSAETVDTWDSLNQINIISALEQEFGVTLPVENAGEFETVSKLKQLLIEHGVTL